MTNGSEVPNCDRFHWRLLATVSIADISASFVMEDIKHETEVPLS